MKNPKMATSLRGNDNAKGPHKKGAVSISKPKATKATPAFKASAEKGVKIGAAKATAAIKAK